MAGAVFSVFCGRRTLSLTPVKTKQNSREFISAPFWRFLQIFAKRVYDPNFATFWGQGVACARAFWGRKYTRMVLRQSRKCTRRSGVQGRKYTRGPAGVPCVAQRSFVLGPCRSFAPGSCHSLSLDGTRVRLCVSFSSWL